MTNPTQASIEKALQNEEKLHKAAEQYAKDIQAAEYDISHLIEEMGFALASTTVDLRVKGTKLLSAVLTLLPKDLLNAKQLEFLATFYADRLKDNHNVLPAVFEGMEALFSMSNLAKENVPKLLQSFFQHTNCQSQVRADRARLLRIFKYVSEHFAEELKAMGGDFLYGLINSLDGERDPRNLDFIFSFMPSFIASFPLLHLCEEMFEIFACYFPIDFNPSKNDPDTITRDALAEKLTSCLVATPEFAEWAITLALEKLESDLLVAKLDSLELINQAALKFPPKVLEPHFETIWQALKQEVYPGADNSDVIASGLRTLRSILEKAAVDQELSRNYQTIIMGVILTHLSDVNQRLFNPSTALALVCVAGDAAFAGCKILNCFLLKLQQGEACADDERLKIYINIAQVYKIAGLRHEALLEIAKQEPGNSNDLHAQLIATLRQHLDDSTQLNDRLIDLKKAALAVLNECTPIISEANRALLYKVLVQLITHDSLDLEFTHLLDQLGALYPIELQSNCIDVYIRNFMILSNFVKKKIYNNLLPLLKQMAFTERILNLIFTHVFETSANDIELRRLALEALNMLLVNEAADQRFIEELQHNNCLIDKLVQLAKAQTVPDEAHIAVLEQIAAALSLIVQQMAVSEQFAIASEYLPQLDLKQCADLFVAKGLLGFLHKDISMDNHFERLLNDLTQLSLHSDNEQLRLVAHHLLCSMANKFDYNDGNKHTLHKILKKLREEIHQGNSKAVEALSWLGKGLIMRGLGEAGDIVEDLAELLDHPSLATVASLAFDIISAEYPQLHLPMIKMLFKQKFFHMVLKKIESKLTSYCEHHLNAFVYVLQSTPHKVLQMNIEKIGPILFKCLESNKTHTIISSLKICENFIKHQDEYFRVHLQHLIPQCLTLTQYKESMQVRIQALNLLFDLTKYPTFVLLPHKVDVILELAPALDDPKRLVRNVAVIARNAWFLIGAPTTE